MMDSNRGNGWTAIDWAKLAGVAVLGGLGVRAVKGGIGKVKGLAREGNSYLSQARKAARAESVSKMYSIPPKGGGWGSIRKHLMRDVNMDTPEFQKLRNKHLKNIIRKENPMFAKGYDKASDLYDKISSSSKFKGISDWAKRSWAGEGPASMLGDIATGRSVAAFSASGAPVKGGNKALASWMRGASSEQLRSFASSRAWAGVGRNATNIQRGAMIAGGYVGANIAWGMLPGTD